jgi:sugar/nucleoside kinase (ribokinase family)
MSILVVGSIALDMVETPFGKVENSPGGSALYFSAAASYFAPVNVVGVVGNDFDFQILGFLKKRQVDLDGVYVEQGETFRWSGIYLENMNQRETIYTHLNVFENFRPDIPEKYRNSSHIFLANIAPELQMQVLDQIHTPEVVVLDTMNFWISRSRPALMEVIKKVNVLILNDEETLQLSEEKNLLVAGKKILDWGPDYLIIKKGEHGAALISREGYFSAPAYPLEMVIDPTGAGDTFAGGVVGYLAKCKSVNEPNLRQAIVHGNSIASFNVEDFSFKRLINLKDSELNQRIELFRKITSF